MNQEEQFDIGQTVNFIGFSDPDGELPDNGELLKIGDKYEVATVNEGDGDIETSFDLKIPNPNFNPEKRASKKANPEYIFVDVYADEIAPAEAPAEAPTDVIEDGEESGVDFADVAKGDMVTVFTTDGEEITGLVTKRLKTKMVIEDEEGLVDLTAKEIATISMVDVESTEEVEEEPAPAPKAKAKAKPKTSKKTETKAKPKAKAKAPAKGKGKTSAKKSASKAKEDTAEDTASEFHGMTILTEEEEDQDILALVNEADDLCELAHELADEAASTEYRLGGVLYHVYISKVYKDLNEDYAGNQGFANYTENELGIRYRKAMYLIDIYAKWNKYGLDPATIAEIGWTKALEVARVMTKDTADQLVELAHDSTVTDLKDTIKESFSKEGEDTREIVKKITFKFRLVEDQADTIQGYLERAADQIGAKSLDEVFVHIVSEWGQQNLDVSTAKSKSRSAKKTK